MAGQFVAVHHAPKPVPHQGRVHDAEMLACIDVKLDWLTDERRIGYAEWRSDPGVFRARANRRNRH